MKRVAPLALPLGQSRRNAKRLARAAGCALILASPLLWAHAHIAATEPEAGAILEQAPERLELRFDSPIRITQFEVTGPEGTVELSEDPLGPLAETHGAVPADTLAPGDYEVVWRGIAEDGHTMSGGYRFAIQE